MFTKKNGTVVPADLAAKHARVMETTAVIRKLFAIEVRKKPGMQSGDPVDATICDQFNALKQGHASTIEQIALAAKLAKPKVPKCEPASFRKRFGAAIRQQRTLTIAGKINKKEQINYLNIATNITKYIKTDFAKACLNMHDYEKQLAAEKAE